MRLLSELLVLEYYTIPVYAWIIDQPAICFFPHMLNSYWIFRCWLFQVRDRVLNYWFVVFHNRTWNTQGQMASLAFLVEISNPEFLNGFIHSTTVVCRLKYNNCHVLNSSRLKAYFENELYKFYPLEFPDNFNTQYGKRASTFFQPLGIHMCTVTVNLTTVFPSHYLFSPFLDQQLHTDTQEAI